MYVLVKLLPTLLSSLSALVNCVYRCHWILLLYHSEDAGPRPTHSPNPSTDGFILPSYSSLPATPAPDTSPGLRAHVLGDTVCPHLCLSRPDYLPIFIPGTVSFPSLSSFCAPPLHDYTILTVASSLLTAVSRPRMAPCRERRPPALRPLHFPLHVYLSWLTVNAGKDHKESHFLLSTNI